MIPRSDNIKGALWALLATALFAMVAAMAKIAVTDYHIFQILFFRQLVVFVSSLPALQQSFPHSLKTRFPLQHAIRLAGAFVALSCGLWAVSVLPLTTAVTLGFAQAFFIVLLSVVLLAETVGRYRWVAVVMGFAGVVVVMRPGVTGLLDANALIPLAGALGAAVAVIMVRRLAQTEATATLLVYQAIFVGVLAGIPLIWLWVSPDTGGLLLLLAIGIISAAGQWAGVKALRLGEASVVGTIKYTELFYAAILGYFVFSEMPDRYTVIGAATIVMSALFLMHREVRSQRETE